MGFEGNDEGELDDQKAENIKDEKDDDIRENEDDTIWDKIDWSEDNSKEQSDSIWNEIDWSEDNSKEQSDSIWNEINWNEDESGEKEIDERENLDDESDAEKNNSNEQQEERNEEDLHENLSSQSTSTVLVSENIEEIQEVDHNQDELEREIEKELEEGVEPINHYLEEEAEFINAYQEMVGEAKEIEEELKQQGEEPLKTEEEWEREIETAAYSAEQLYESAKEIENASTGVDELEIEKEADQSAEISEPQLSNSKEEISELEELADMIEQHQVEPFIEEALETKPEPIVNEKEIEKLQEMDIEEQFKTVHDNEYLEELIESQNEKIELETEGEPEAQLNNSKENFSELETELEEERDEIEQHQVEAAIEEELETKPEPIVNDEVIEEIQEIQEMELEEQFQTVNFNEYIEELVENQEEEKIQEHNKREQEQDKREQEQENIEQTQTQEVIQQSTYLQEQLEEQEQNLEQENEDIDEVEQHQVETAIEEELETEPKPIIQEEELEYIKNFEPEKQLEAELLYELIEELAQKQKEVKKEIEEKEEQNDISTEQKVAQIKRKLQIPQENSAETEVEVVNKEVNITLVEPKQEEQEQEDTDKNSEKNYETAKSRYKQQTGKRPIYANKETKGFKQWLEQSKESKEEEKTKQIQEPKEEQKKEESWKSTLKNWIEQATEIEQELKSELTKLVEKYNELEKLIKKYKQLYNKAKSEELSQNEMVEFAALNKMLLKLDPIKIEMFLDLRDIKRYLNEKYFYDFWDKPRVNQIRTHFFTHISQQYKKFKEAQKKELFEEIINLWIENASKKEINLNSRAKLREIVANYSELNTVSIKFMELLKKSKKKQLSEKEKSELKTLKKILGKLEPSIIQMFSKLRAIKNYLNTKNGNIDKKHAYQIFNKFFADFDQISILLPFMLNYSPLSSKQIQKHEIKYQKMLEQLCVQYALEFKDILIKEYGYNILELGKQLPLATHFDFNLAKYIGKVTPSNVRRAVSVEFLERVKQHIIKKFSKLKKKTVARETSFRKVIDFIDGYQEFSSYVSKRFVISRIKYQEGSEKLATKSWLIENLRYLFPKKFGLPLSDNLLSWFVFKDTPNYGEGSKLGKHTSTDEVVRHMLLSDLLAIDYRVNKLTIEAFNNKNIKITEDGLETLKKSLSYLVYYYVFGGYDDSAQVSATKRRGAEVGKNFFSIEYEVIRAIIFAAAEANSGEPIGIRVISRASGIPDISVHLRVGTGFGEHLGNLLNYFMKISKNRASDSSSKIFRDAKETLEGYHDAYRARHKAFVNSKKFPSVYQRNVHRFVEAFLNLKFISEVSLRSIVKEKFVTTINDQGFKEKIFVHNSFRLDGCRELSKSLKNYLGLDDKWIGIAFEAQSEYYHNDSIQKERDRKKRLISKEKNILLFVVWDNWDQNTWGIEILKQIKAKTGIEIPLSKLGGLAKFLGGDLNR